MPTNGPFTFREITSAVASFCIPQAFLEAACRQTGLKRSKCQSRRVYIANDQIYAGFGEGRNETTNSALRLLSQIGI